MELNCDREELTCVGTFQMIHEGEMLEVQGEFVDHSAYGRQLKISSYSEKVPEDTMAIERYLGSGAVKGVGKALAARIVRRFGKDTFRIIEEEPERLTEVKGISERIAREIAQQMQEKADLRNVMLVLQQYGITMSLGVRLYKQYGSAVCEILRENPYRLADDIQGIGFRMADEIAGRIGIHSDSDYRIRSGLFYMLTQASAQGHMYLPRQILMERTAALLGLLPEQLEKSLTDLMMERKVILKPDPEQGDRIYAQQYYHIELDTARLLMELNLCDMEKESSMERTLKAIERETKIALDDLQKEAVMQAASHGLFILTGGPGTGKTTTVKAILNLYEGIYDRVALCAPTGRAAKRLTELTGHSASTIHRLLEVDYSTGSVRFIHNEKNLLPFDVIILDEMSMVDAKLFQALLAAARYHCRIIMVGDADQLPSVGPGSVLGEILQADVLPTVRLNEIFRQAQKSMIVQNAHRIVEGQMPIKGGRDDDFFMIESTGLACQRLMCDLVSPRLPKSYGYDPVRDIQVLCPTKVGPTGSVELNRRLQAILNPPAPDKPQIIWEQSGRVLRCGDKVMQIKNDYDIPYERDGAEAGVGAYNGDMGIITAVDPESRAVTVQMDDRKYIYGADQLAELEPAYAVTVHKSQGSEFPAVIMPVADVPARLCYRNLLYTGVTRARRLCILAGTRRTEQAMVDNVRQNMRYSGLRYLLREAVTPAEKRR